MSTSLVNKTNAHPGGFLSSNEGPVVGCTGKGGSATGSCGIKNYRGLVGGKKRRKSRKKKRVSGKRRKSRKNSIRRSRNINPVSKARILIPPTIFLGASNRNNMLQN